MFLTLPYPLNNFSMSRSLTMKLIKVMTNFQPVIHTSHPQLGSQCRLWTRSCRFTTSEITRTLSPIAFPMHSCRCTMGNSANQKYWSVLGFNLTTSQCDSKKKVNSQFVWNGNIPLKRHYQTEVNRNRIRKLHSLADILPPTRCRMFRQDIARSLLRKSTLEWRTPKGMYWSFGAPLGCSLYILA